MINWFEWRKFEIEINDYVDWRAAGSPAIKTPSLPTSPIGCSTPTRSTRLLTWPSREAVDASRVGVDTVTMRQDHAQGLRASLDDLAAYLRGR
jgi:hypothetical protein